MEMGPRTGRLSAFPQYWVNAVVPLNLSEPVAPGQMYSCGPEKNRKNAIIGATVNSSVAANVINLKCLKESNQQ